jgi:hypothetical protein
MPLKSDQIVFATQAIPALFHRTPEQFLAFLEKDGNKFLRFYWDEAGKNEGVGTRTPPLGLNHDIRKPDPHTTVILVILPRPKAAPEAFYLALVYRPLRRTPFLGVSDTTKVIALELADSVGEAPATLLREWTRKLKSETLGPGPEPHLEQFYQAVLERLQTG